MRDSAGIPRSVQFDTGARPELVPNEKVSAPNLIAPETGAEKETHYFRKKSVHPESAPYYWLVYDVI